MSQDIEDMKLDASLVASIKERVMNRIMVPCPEGGETARTSTMDWIQVTDKLEVKVLYQDLENKVQSSLWRLKAGCVVPSHAHHSDEECLVLDGEVRFGEHALFTGDFHLMKKGSVHPEMTTTSGAVVYLKHDMHDDISWLLG